MNGAVVNPERTPVRQQADRARQSLAQPERERAVAHIVTSTVGRIVEQCSRLYGYAFLISGIDSIFLVGVSSLPLTKWDDDDVPHADTFAVSALLGTWLA